MALRDKEAHRAYCRAYYYAHDGRNRKRRPRGPKLTPEERRERKRLRSIEYRKRNKEKIQAYRKSAKRKAAQSEYMRKWRAEHPEYQRAYYATHREAYREYAHAAMVFRHIREMVDADFYAANRAKRRAYAYARYKRLGLTWGQGGRPSMRIPDYCVRGQVLDVRSQWLINNMTDEQRAYARELAIERKKQRESRGA